MSVLSIRDSSSSRVTDLITTVTKPLSVINNSFDSMIEVDIDKTFEILKTPSKVVKLTVGNLSTLLLSYALFSKERLHSFLTEGIQVQPLDFKDRLEKFKVIAEADGWVIPEGFNPSKILDSACPKGEYISQMTLISNFKHPLIFEIVTNVYNLSYSITMSVFEEFAFRKCTQELLLKDVPKMVLQKVSPSHANIIDTKIYTIFRVVIVSIIFASMHYINQDKMSDEENMFQLLFALIAGLNYGYLKETDGLSMSIAAHILHNVTSLVFSLFIRC